MLFGKDCRWNQKGYLLVVPDRLESGPERNLGFTVTHITADKPVHGHRRLHVSHDVFHGASLIRCLRVFKGIFKIPKVSVMRGKCVSFLNFAPGIEFEKFSGHLANRFFDPLLDPCPRFASHLVQTRGNAIHPGVFLNAVHPVHRDIELVCVGVFYEQKVVCKVCHLKLDKASIPADTMFNMHNKVACLQVLKGNPLGSCPFSWSPWEPMSVAKDLIFRDDSNGLPGPHEPGGKLAKADGWGLFGTAL